jgi:hypothetical protein
VNILGEENISIFKEIRQYALLSQFLIKRFDPECEFVRRLVEEEVKRLIAEGRWKRYEEGKPWIKSVEREGYVLRIAVIHARSGEYITGADLVFELKDNKIILVQSKRVGLNRRFIFPRLQLLKLAELESQFNFGRDSVVIQTFPQIIFYPIIQFKKTAFYHLIMAGPFQTQERFFHISEVLFTLGNRKSVSQNEFLHMGITQKEFDDMFWHCNIGAPDVEEDLKRDMLYIYSLATNRMVIWLHIEQK